MINHHLHRSIPAALMAGAVVAIVAAGGGCSAVSSAENAAATVEGASQPCDAFDQGPSAISSLSIDGDTKAFVTASANLVTIANTAQSDVYTACKSIDGDLKITDSWTALEGDAGISDPAVTEACKQAANHITTVIQANASAGCQLVISGGYCTVDEQAQVTCESSCTSAQNCTPGNITMLCTPAELTGQCNGTCKANAYCEGSVTTQATCTGSCAGDCTGMCDSTECHGTHCGGTCAGTCSGECKLTTDAMAGCGANVNCRGGCSVAYTAPACETTVTPPSCNVTKTCQDSCTSTAEATAKCTKPGVSLECNGTVSSDLQTVINTVQANLPAIVLLVQTQGKIVEDAGTQVVNTANTLSNDLTTLSGQALSCANAAIHADATASASLTASVNASVSVTGACNGPTTTTDGGSTTTTTTTDGGSATTDGGSATTDGGSATADGGSATADGGS